MSKKLHLGVMKTQELAEWFQISYSTFRKVKKQKLDELKLYCNFNEIYGGVDVIEIYEEEYIKDSKKNYELIKSSFDEEWNADGLDTCSNVAVKIYDKHKNELTIGDNTAYNYVIKARNELYGKPFMSLGELGSCMYIWCRKEYDEQNNIVVYTEFTDEEQAIKKELMKKYFSTDVEKEIMVAEMVNHGEITKAEAYDVLCEMKNLNGGGFMAFKAELEHTLGCKIAKATLLDRNADKIEFIDNKTHMISSKSIKSKQNV